MKHKVTVYAYDKAHLIIVVDNPHEDIRNDFWVPRSQETFGCVLCDARPSTLAFSPEAIELLKKISIGRDAIGDVDWFRTRMDGKPPGFAFSWFGPISRIVNVKSAVAARDFRVYDQSYSFVENYVPSDIERKVAAALKADSDNACYEPPHA